jgi:hypothetical protein
MNISGSSFNHKLNSKSKLDLLDESYLLDVPMSFNRSSRSLRESQLERESIRLNELSDLEDIGVESYLNYALKNQEYPFYAEYTLKQEIENLHAYIILLKKQIPSNSVSKIPILHHTSSNPEGKMIKILSNDNKKLRSSLSIAEKNLQRLYNEIKIMSDQLLIYQKRCEREDYVPGTLTNINYFTKLVMDTQSNVTENYKDLEYKIKKLDKKLRKLNLKQADIIKTIEKVPKSPGAFSEHFKNNLIDKEKLIQKEYKERILELESQIEKNQKDYQGEKTAYQENIQKLELKNSKLLEELNELKLKKSGNAAEYQTKSIHRVTADFLFRSGSMDNYLKLKKESIKADIAENKKYIEYITECYEEKITALETQIKETLEKYNALKKSSLKTLEKFKNSEEILKTMEKNSEATLFELKDKIKKLSYVIETNKIEIDKLLKENLELKDQLSDENLKTKYSRLVMDFKINENLLEEYQKQISVQNETIKEQTVIINSLKSGFYPFNSRKDLIDCKSSDSSSVESENLKKDSLQSIENYDQLQDFGINKTIIEKKNGIILDLREQISDLSRDYEETLQNSLKLEELYQNSKNNLLELEEILINLDSGSFLSKFGNKQFI